MEPIFKQTGTTKGSEVLCIENVEVQKLQGNRQIFSGFGDLQVLHFKDYNRYCLRLNDWLYTLFRRIPLTSEKGHLSQTFILPGTCNSTFRLIFSDASSPAFGNFETLLRNHSGFTSGTTQKEHSPDDKLKRPARPQHLKDTTTSLTSNTVTSTITGFVKSGFSKMKHATLGLKGTKNLNSTKHPMRLTDIKNKNFRKTAKSTFKKSYFDDELKLKNKFYEMRKGNTYNTQATDFKKFSDSACPSYYLFKEDVEESIFRGKDIIEQRGFTTGFETEKKGIVESIKSGFTGLKDTLTGSHTTQQTTRPVQKDTQATQPGTQNLVGMTHYEG